MADEPTLEKELKFAEVELAPLRERLDELESERVSAATLEDNWIFDQGGALEREGSVLRLRIDGAGVRLTFKGKQRFEGHTKIREEHETAVGEAKTMRRVLEALGYRVVKRYQKRREEWLLGGVTIALDHTPIGDFVEFEGEGCDTVARRCGLDPEHAERRSYLRLYEDYRSDNPGAPEEMVFDE